MAEITKIINIIRQPDDTRDYAAEFIQSTDHKFGLVEVYEKHRTELAKAYCKAVDIHFTLNNNDITFDATKTYNGDNR